VIFIRVNKSLGQYEAGSVVRIEALPNGQPKSSYWRRRLKDAQIDSCCEICSDPRARQESPPPTQGRKKTTKKEQVVEKPTAGVDKKPST